MPWRNARPFTASMSWVAWLLLLCMASLVAFPAHAANVPVPVDCSASGTLPLVAERARSGLPKPADNGAGLTALAAAFKPDTGGSSYMDRIHPRWLRLVLHNTGSTPCRRMLVITPSALRDVRVHVLQDGQWSAMRAGTRWPLEDWPVPSERLAFPLTLPPDANTTVLIRVGGYGTLSAARLMLQNPSRFERMHGTGSMVEGLFFGALLMLALMALLLGYLYRRQALAWLGTATMAYAGYMLLRSNLPFVRLWPDSPSLNLWMTRCAIGLVYVSSTAYVVRIVGRGRLQGWWEQAMHVIIMAFAVMAVVGGAVPDQALVTRLLLVIDQISRMLLGVGLLMAWQKHVTRGWYPPILVGLLWIQGMAFHIPFSDTASPWPNLGNMTGTTLAVFGVLVLVATLAEVAHGRRRERRMLAIVRRQRRIDQQRLEKLVTKRTHQWLDARQARRMVMARISHDLRSALSTIVESARQWQRDAGNKDYRHLIELNAARQIDLIDELVEFSDEESTVIDMIPVAGYLPGFLTRMAEQITPAIARHGNRLSCTFDPSLPAVVTADFRRLQQILANLLGNAGKFTQHGNVWFDITLLAREGSSCRIRFTVTDDGIGIPDHERERLLQPFQRGSNATDTTGSGLGLNIVQRLLDGMESTLAMTARACGGSEFSFELLLDVATEDTVEPFDDDDDGDVDGLNRTVLIIDSHHEQRERLCDLINSAGFMARTASGLAEAQRILVEQRRRIAVIMTDQQLDDGNGRNVLDHARAADPTLPVLLYSGTFPRKPGCEPCMTSFDAILLKPAHTETLLRLLDRLAEPPPRVIEPERTTQTLMAASMRE